jgi:Uri superfamily endonuclease
LNAVKGIYVLVVQLSKNTDVTVGKLGKSSFAKGLYAYVGSAQNVLEKRIERHFRKEKRVFWHVDYLLQSPASKILKVFYKTAGKPEECAIAKKIGAEGEAIAGFGCSDCHCKSHLFRVNDYDFLREFMQERETPKLSASS